MNEQNPVRQQTYLKSLDACQFNTNAEKAFVRLMIILLDEIKPLTVQTALQEAAFELNISTETAKRYLIKHTARRALFQLAGNQVQARQIVSSTDPLAETSTAGDLPAQSRQTQPAEVVPQTDEAPPRPEARQAKPQDPPGPWPALQRATGHQTPPPDKKKRHSPPSAKPAQPDNPTD
jgi:hypothetical protein